MIIQISPLISLRIMEIAPMMLIRDDRTGASNNVMTNGSATAQMGCHEEEADDHLMPDGLPEQCQLPPRPVSADDVRMPADNPDTQDPTNATGPRRAMKSMLMPRMMAAMPCQRILKTLADLLAGRRCPSFACRSCVMIPCSQQR